MTTVYCSKKLDNFLKCTVPSDPAQAGPNLLGNWNGHYFHADGKRCMLFLNDKTCYSLLVVNALKRRIGNFKDFFKERVVRQLSEDFKLSERSEILIRKSLGPIDVRASNNNRNINGTMNRLVLAVKERPLHFGTFDDFALSYWLNETPLTTKVLANREKSGYFFPREAMGELVARVTEVDN
jgi:hypothetical protein